jgi:sugar lactone lactonase YvrE
MTRQSTRNASAAWHPLSGMGFGDSPEQAMIRAAGWLGETRKGNTMSWLACFRGRVLGIMLCMLALSLSRTAPTQGQTLLLPEVNAQVVRHFSLHGDDVGTFAVVGLDEPSGLALDARGVLYVSNYADGIAGNGTIRRFGPTGGRLSDFATGLNGPEGMAFDSQGRLYVAVGGSDHGAIRRFSPKGQDLGDFVTGLNYPIGVAFDSAGILYVAAYFDNAIRCFGPSGEDLGVFGTTVTGPIGLAVDQDDNLYVAATRENAVRRFAPTGEDLGTFAALPGPFGLAFDRAGNLYVTAGGGKLWRVAPTGEDLSVLVTGLKFPYLPVCASHAFPAPRPLVVQLHADTGAAALPGALGAQVLDILDSAQALLDLAATQFRADHTADAIILLEGTLLLVEYYQDVLNDGVTSGQVMPEVAAPLLETAAQVTEQLQNGIDVLRG